MPVGNYIDLINLIPIHYSSPGVSCVPSLDLSRQCSNVFLIYATSTWEPGAH